jgi:D-alanyl-lipoteichoic acid acyltransferase DltB (MBOAT superfamily)
MSGQSIVIAEGLGYLLAGRLLVRWLSGVWRDVSFAALNLAGLYLFFFSGADRRYAAAYLAYLGLVAFQYVMLRRFVGKPGWLPWLAFFTPILALVVVRYVPFSLCGPGAGGPLFIGISYLAFRSSQLVLEVRNGSALRPGFFAYLGFCFFVPTLAVGPINPYSQHCRAFEAQPPAIPPARAALRIILGLIKFKFLGSLCFQMTAPILLRDDHYHPCLDLPVAILFYYLFLYFNFSGCCDVAIGAAGLMGIPVAENFQSPFAARNVKDFWNRWHITLSQYMREVVFSPLSKFLVRSIGPAHANHAIALAIVVVFLLVGIWHGVGWNFAAFGALHALGVVANHYYTLALKKWLGREGFKAYNQNRVIHTSAVVLTFCYCAVSLFFFANTFPEIKHLLSILR